MYVKHFLASKVHFHTIKSSNKLQGYNLKSNNDLIGLPTNLSCYSWTTIPSEHQQVQGCH